MKIKTVLCAALLGLGLLQPLGYVTGSQILKGLGLATQASPLPIVFSDVKGLETFASDFWLQVETESGRRTEYKITPEIYSKLGGPYNRRNAYGAVISYGPRLPEKIWKSVLGYGFCSKGPLSEKLGMTQEPIRRAEIKIKTKTAGRNDEWVMPIECDS